MIRVIIILFLFLPGILYASSPDSLSSENVYSIFQELKHNAPGEGHVHIKGDSAINGLINFHVSLNQKQRTFTGYRIQIFSGNSSDYNIGQLQGMKSSFEQEFTGTPAYLKYYDPDFKIRVGNFRTRLDCIPALYKIRKKYPSSYPVKTEITWNELNYKGISEDHTTE